jgi:NADH dehydrogenase
MVRKRIVVVGGGFAGLNCAQRLAGHDDFHITLLDRNNYQQFQPLLYQVATGVLSPDNAAFNLRAVLAAHENVDIKMTEIVSVDLATCTARHLNPPMPDIDPCGALWGQASTLQPER